MKMPDLLIRERQVLKESGWFYLQSRRICVSAIIAVYPLI